MRFKSSDYLAGVDSGRLHFGLNAWSRCENERKCRSGVDSDLKSIRNYWSGYLDGMKQASHLATTEALKLAKQK